MQLFMQLFALVMLCGPTLLLVAAGVAAARTRPPVRWRVLLGLAAISTIAWLAYAALYEHETPCDGRSFAVDRVTRCATVFGTRPPLDVSDAAGWWLLLAAFLVPAAIAGWRRVAHPLAIGAALAAGPGILAFWTAPRGDNDGLWVLQLWTLPAMGGFAALTAMVAERTSGARQEGPRVDPSVPGLATPLDRVTAFALDLVAATVVLWLPVAALSDAGQEPAAVAVGVAIGCAYLAVPTALRGASPAQLLLRMAVVDSATGAPLCLGRAGLRSLLLVVETMVSWTLLGIPLLAEVISMNSSGRSVVDRVLGTSVVPHVRTRDTAPVGAERP